MTYVIAEPCVDVKDKARVEECPVDCVYEGQLQSQVREG
ncbi:NAD-dependent dihydropyrimidine dehydrogenase PreA subunit [Streptomyces achromogenes]|nr:NAD-dependent dihydropyrimidine dehydrogenase PreA subunit [Streptomyces achromogenes]